MRYGGAIFALPLGNVGADGADAGRRAGASPRRRPRLPAGHRAACAARSASWPARPAEADALEPLDLLQRANEALAVARQQGGETRSSGTTRRPAPTVRPTDRLLGIFTGRTDKDYRNMGLLWDVLQALSGAPGQRRPRPEVVDRLFTRAAARRARRSSSATTPACGCCSASSAHDDGEPRVAAAPPTSRRTNAAVVTDGRGQPARCASAPRSDDTGGRAPAAAAGRRRAARHRRAARSAPSAWSAVPRCSTSTAPTCHVLTGVAAQLAVALDREHLAELHRVHAEHERRRLQAEVQDLRARSRARSCSSRRR